MNIKISSFLVLISFFPTFIVRSNLNLYEIFFSLILFLVPILFINYLIIKFNILKNKFLTGYFSMIITYGIDNHLGLWNGVIQPLRYELFKIIQVIYVPGFILFIIIAVLIYILILRLGHKFYNVISIFLITIFIFNVFDRTKDYKKLQNFAKEKNLKFENTKLIMIFDEMSGINSLESQNISGEEFNNEIKGLFKKYNFNFYPNAISISGNTASSVSSLLNFSDTTQIREKVTKKSNNYFYEYDLTNNLFFDNFKSISVYQSIHLNYCNHKLVLKCESYNPFNQELFLKGFKDSFFTKIISIWKLNGSISSTITWRLLRELRMIDSLLEPEGHKATFNNLFKKIEDDIDKKKYQLIFVHTLVPHIPYGFDKDCNYDGSLSLLNLYFTKEKKIEQHNLERKCVVLFLDKFLAKLENEKKLDFIDLLILSDHGARITKEKNSFLSTIYANRNKDTNYKEILDEKTIQELFREKFK